jgi:hypothetical protein
MILAILFRPLVLFLPGLGDMILAILLRPLVLLLPGLGDMILAILFRPLVLLLPNLIFVIYAFVTTETYSSRQHQSEKVGFQKKNKLNLENIKQGNKNP